MTATTNQPNGYEYFGEIPAEQLKAALIESFDSLSDIHQLKDTAFDSLYTFITTVHLHENESTGLGTISENEIAEIVFPIGRWYQFLSKVSRLKSK
jgi:hypothetical protein